MQPIELYKHVYTAQILSSSWIERKKEKNVRHGFLSFVSVFSVSVVPFALSVFRCLVMPSLLSFEAFASPFQVEIFASVGNALSDLFDFVYL